MDGLLIEAIEILVASDYWYPMTLRTYARGTRAPAGLRPLPAARLTECVAFSLFFVFTVLVSRGLRRRMGGDGVRLKTTTSNRVLKFHVYVPKTTMWQEASSLKHAEHQELRPLTPQRL